MKLIRLIASPVLMYILAGLYALILAVATFVENSYGPAIAREYFYYAPHSSGKESRFRKN